jgi:hypothetical protein
LSYDSCVWRAALFASLLTSAAFAAQTVDGHIVNAVTGIDVPGVDVKLIKADKVAHSAITDPQGRFHFEAVEAGTYFAVYSARGYWNIPNLLVDEDFDRQCGHCFQAERGGQPFQITAGDPVRLEVKMPPIGRLSGKVLDHFDRPVPNAAVHLRWGESWFCKLPTCGGVSRQTKTNEKGEFAVTDLDVPGAWLLSAIAPASWKPPESDGDRRLAWAQTFYPGVADPHLATSVMVRVGGDVSNVDIKLAAVPVHRIRGLVLDPRGNPTAKAAVALGTLTRTTAEDGTFEFDAVPEGDWRISATVDQAGSKLWSAQWVQSKGRDVDNLQLRLSAPFAMQGTVSMEVPDGAPVPKQPGVVLAFNAGPRAFSDKPAGAFLEATPDAAGNFQIQNVYAGAYLILPNAAPPQYYLDSIRIGGRDAIEPDVEIPSGAAQLAVVYKPGGGAVRGKVENCASGTVRLLPRDKSLRRQGFIFFAACDANDSYTITSVRPGDYYALAIAGDSPTPWYASTWDDDTLLVYAGLVTVRSGENTSADLHAIKP